MAGTTGRQTSSLAKVEYGCDNMGAIGYGNEHCVPLKERQYQGDLLRVFKHLVLTAKVNLKINHDYGHQDRDRDYNQLDNLVQTNVGADGAVLRANRGFWLPTRGAT